MKRSNSRGSPPNTSLKLPVISVVTRYIILIALKFMDMRVYSIWKYASEVIY